MIPRASGRSAVGAALLAVVGGPAAAHGGLPGGEGFLSGVVHPLVAIEHLILLLSIGLLAGQRPPAQRSASFAAVGLGLLGGLAATRGGQGVTPFATPAILALGCLTGGLLALSPTRFPRALLPILAILAGLTVGLDTDVIGATGAARAIVTASVAGVLTGVYLIVLDAAALAAVAARPPFPIAIRILGSWIVAIALMLFALSISPVRSTG